MNTLQAIIIAAGFVIAAIIISEELRTERSAARYQLMPLTGSTGGVWAWRVNTTNGEITICFGANSMKEISVAPVCSPIAQLVGH